MLRRAIAPLVVLLLAVLIVVFWPDSDSEPPVSDPSTTTTTTAPPATDHFDLRSDHNVYDPGRLSRSRDVEEAEEILRELWFGWFEGIYNQDEDRIREVVASNPKLVAALAPLADAFRTLHRAGNNQAGTSEMLTFRCDHCLARSAHVDVSSFVATALLARSPRVLWNGTDGSSFRSWEVQGRLMGGRLRYLVVARCL